MTTKSIVNGKRKRALSFTNREFHFWYHTVYSLKGRSYCGSNQWERSNNRIKESEGTLKFVIFSSVFFYILKQFNLLGLLQ